MVKSERGIRDLPGLTLTCALSAVFLYRELCKLFSHFFCPEEEGESLAVSFFPTLTFCGESSPMVHLSGFLLKHL